MTRLMRSVLLSTALVLGATGLAQAQQASVCLPHATAVGELAKGYDEHSVGFGIGASGETLYELFVADTGTWTILKTSPDGMACVMAAGDVWQDDFGELTPAGSPV